MAGLQLALETSSGKTTGTALKTILQATAPANQGLLVEEWGITFGGDDATEDPVYVTIEIQGAGGTGDTKNPVKRNQADDETIQSTGLEDIDSTAQPTQTAVLWQGFVDPKGGFFTDRRPIGKEYRVKGGQKIGITITAQQDNPVAAHLHYSE